MQPKISIVTPSYNQGRFIEDNLKSVANQKYGNVEHIVVDGGSTDDTIEILREYEDTYDLRWVSEEDRGQSHAINKGIKMATGEWIGWQNSDDYYLPNAFSTIVEALNKQPGKDVIYGDAVVVDENGSNIDRMYNIQPSPFVQQYWSLFTNNQTTFFRQSVFDEVGPLSEELDLTMDAELFWRLIRSDMDMYHIPYFLGAFRQQSDAKTYNQTIETIRNELQEPRCRPEYESYIPLPILQYIAKLVKAYYLAKDRRWNAFLYNLGKFSPR